MSATTLQLPALDRELSPHTGWTREHWTALADRILSSARPFASPHHALISFPGAPGGYGSAVDGLEGFARTFMLAAFRIAGSPGDTGSIAEWFSEGLAAGTDPSSPERWLRPDEVDQAKVEAAALAIGLHLTRDVIWNRLDARVQGNIVDYLSTVIGQSYPPINWVWFRVVVEQFLASVGGPYRRADIEADLAVADGFFRTDGWLSDGSSRAFDHYTGWALHLYPVLWAGMVAGDPQHEECIARYRAHLDRYLDDAVTLVGADGSPLIQGRSLVYRFAAAAPFWAGALAGSETLAPGLVRRAASGIVSHFADRGAPDARGILTLGWHDEWRAMAQSYSGPGSPYWASKGMLGLALPADHPVWTAVEEPLPVELGDVQRVIAAPGWLVSGTQADGLVRVVNHGTDHGHEGEAQIDPPLYARFGYSTATAPLLRGMGVEHPLDGSVTATRDGVPSHRSGFARGPLEALLGDDGAEFGWGASVARAHWIDDAPTGPDHGDGRAASAVTRGPLIETRSLVRGAWEVRFVRVSTTGDEDVAAAAIRVGGWTLSGAARPLVDGAVATGNGLTSALVPLAGFEESGVREDLDATPLGAYSATPWCSTADPVTDAAWRIVAVLLSGDANMPSPTPQVDLVGADRCRVVWPDGAVISIDLPEVNRARVPHQP